MALSSELLRRLDQEEEPLAKRLQLAVTVFEASDLPVQRKEELVLKWLCKCGENNVYSKDVWRVLAVCLGSIHERTLLRPAASNAIQQSLCEIIASRNVDENSKRAILDCIACMVENVHFQLYFRRQPEQFLDFVSAVLNNSDGNAESCPRILQSIYLINKQVFEKELFAVLFIQKVLQPVTNILGSLSVDNEFNRIKAEVFKCVQQVLFPKSRTKTISSVLACLFEGTSNDQCASLESLFEFLSSSVVTSSSSALINLFSIIFQAFISSYSGDMNSVFRMFVTLCYFVGVNPEVKLPSGDEYKCLLRSKKFKKTFPSVRLMKSAEANETSLSVVRSMLIVLSDSYIRQDVSGGEVPFHEWLQAFVTNALSSTSESCISVALFEVLSALIHLDPLIIEPNTAKILEIVMPVGKDTEEVRTAYSSFMCDILNMFVKLSQLQKLTARMLMLRGVDSWRTSVEVSDVLPEEFCAQFQSAVTMLPGWQTIGIMRSLVYHLDKDCIAVLEKPQDDCPLLLLQVVSRLLCCFLCGTRIADHSVPLQVVSKFSDTMTELHALLGKLGQALLHKEHNCVLMTAFLQLCYNWAEIRVLLRHYSGKPDLAGELQLADLQEDVSATNLTYLYPYLTSELWHLVAQRISNFGEADCKELLAKVVLQKLRCVLMFADESKVKQDVTSAAAKYLSSHARESWRLLLTGTNALFVMPLFNVEQLESVANHIVQEIVCKSDSRTEWMDALSRPGVQEAKMLVVALSSSTCSAISKLFTRTKRKRDSDGAPSSLVKQVVSKLNACQVLKCLAEDDLDSLTPAVTEMGAAVDMALQQEKNDISVANGHRIDLAVLHRCLLTLKLLPLQFSPVIIKSQVLITVLALIVTLEDSEKLEDEEQSSEIRSLLCKDLLLGLLDSPHPPDLSSYLDVGRLAHWLMLKDLPLSRELQNLLFQRLFEPILGHSFALGQLQEALPMLQKHASSLSQDTRALEMVLALLQVLNKHSKHHENPDDHLLCQKYYRRLSQGVIEVLHHLDGTAPSPAFPEELNLVLVHYLNKKDPKHHKKFASHLNKLVEVSLAQMQSREVLDSSSSTSYLNVLLTLLENRTQLSAMIPSDLVHKVWTVVIGQQSNSVCDVGKLKKVLETATEKELYAVLKDLTASTKRALKSLEDVGQTKGIFLAWKSVVSSKFKDGRSNARKMALEQLYQVLAEFVNKEFIHGESIRLPLLDLLLTTAHNTQLHMSHEMLGLCLESITAVTAVETEDTLELCSVSVRLLQALLTGQESLVLDCIPAFLQCYRQLLQMIAAHGSVNRSSAHVQACADCAHSLERLTNMLKERKVHFVRVAAYMIADFLQQFESYTFYPEVKVHYSNCVYSLLSVCDNHALSFLSRNLSPASQQLLKTFYNDYKKFHHFTGKV